MTQFASKAITSVNQLSVDDDTRADTCAESNHDEVLHSACHAVNHLAYSSRISVVCKSYGNVAETLGEHLCQWNYAIVSPRKIGGELDSALIEIAVGRSYTHRLYEVQASHLVDDYLQGVNASVNISLNALVALSLYCRCGLDFAS